MTELLALTSSVLYGGADFLGGLTTKRLPARLVIAWSRLAGLGALGLGLLLVPAVAVTTRDLVLGVLGSLSGLAGLIVFYRALADGRMAVAAPIAGAVGAAVPVLVDLSGGTRLTALEWAGIAAALLAILVIGVEHLRDLSEPVLGKALLAGLGFAGFFVAFHGTSPDAGLVPLLAGDAVSIPVAFLLAARTAPLTVPGRRSLGTLVVLGSLDAGATLAATLAVQRGALGVSAVLGSLYPAVTVVIAAIVLREHPTRRQWIGVLAAVVAAAALAG